MRAVQQTIKHWEQIFPYAHVPSNEFEYEKLLAFLNELMEWSRHHSDEETAAFLKLIATNIASYESKHYTLEKVSPIQVLKFLMEEHELGQHDLPEIGSQSLVSKILNGERQLTVLHILNLSKRFGVSPGIFLSY